MKSKCIPIASKSRQYSRSDSVLACSTLGRHLGKSQATHVMDYSQTVNKYTLLDAYPIPRMRDVVQNVARYKVYSTLDLTTAYHQVELPLQDRPYTAFEAALWQWERIPLD